MKLLTADKYPRLFATMCAVGILASSAAIAGRQNQHAPTGTPPASPKPAASPKPQTMQPAGTPAPSSTPAPAATPKPKVGVTRTPTPAMTPPPSDLPRTTPPTAPPAPTSTPAPSGLPSPVKFTNISEGLPTDGMWKCDPVLVDLNGDKHVDLAALPRLGSGPRVWLGDGSGHWKESSGGLTPGDRSCGGGMEAADVNNDGKLDLVAADHCQGVYVYLGDGAGAWNMVTKELFPKQLITDEASEMQVMARQGAEDVAVGDVNGDGKLDLVVGGSDKGGINIYFGDGTGSSWTHFVGTGLPTDDWANRVALADMNGDQHLDIVATFATGPRVWINDGKGVFTAKEAGLPTPIVKGIYTGLGIGDIDSDGRLDFAVANWVDGPEVYLQQLDGAFQKTPDVFPQMVGGAIGLGLADIDGDSKLDLVVAGRLEPTAGFVRGVFALLGDGKGGFRFIPDSGLPTTGLAATTGIGIADVTGDGVVDVAAGSGLIVETTDDGPKDSSIPQHLLVWAGKKVGK